MLKLKQEFFLISILRTKRTINLLTINFKFIVTKSQCNFNMPMMNPKIEKEAELVEFEV